MNVNQGAPRAVAVVLTVVTPLLASTGCSRDAQAMTPERLQQQYGVTGAYNDTVATPEGSICGTVVPVRLADGREAQLVIPAR